VEAVLAESQKDSAPKLKTKQFPPNLKKNPTQNYMVAVLAKSQKESAPKLCVGSSRQISNRIRPKIMWRRFPLNIKKNPCDDCLCGGSSRRI
jgi:hypothetical protein